MKTIRSFIAIALDAPIRRSVGRLLERLAEDKDGIKWVPIDNLHLTLKFLGDVDNVEVPRICDSIRAVCESIEPFDLEFAGASGLPNPSRPRVICVAVEDPSGLLCQLVRELETRLADLGFKPESRDYVPHLTLGRTRGGSRYASDAVIEKMRRENNCRIGAMRVDNVQLVASFLDKGGPTYQVMDTIELA